MKNHVVGFALVSILSIPSASASNIAPGWMQHEEEEDGGCTVVSWQSSDYAGYDKVAISDPNWRSRHSDGKTWYLVIADDECLTEYLEKLCQLPDTWGDNHTRPTDAPSTCLSP